MRKKVKHVQKHHKYLKAIYLTQFYFRLKRHSLNKSTTVNSIKHVISQDTKL